MTRRPHLIPAALVGLACALPTAWAQGPALSQTEEEQEIIRNLLGDRKTTEVHEIFPELLQRGAIPIPPSEKGDPMVIPFVKDEAVRADLLTRMNEAAEAARNSEALAIARHLVINFPTSPEAEKAQVLIEVLAAGGDTTTTIERPVTDGKQPVLPTFVATNTKMILTSPTGNQVMVGYHILREGDPVPDHPTVVVEEIRATEVVYKVSNEFMSKTFVVSVQGNN